MLLKVFQRLGVYNPDVRLPAEVSCTTIPIEQSVILSSSLVSGVPYCWEYRWSILLPIHCSSSASL